MGKRRAFRNIIPYAILFASLASGLLALLPLRAFIQERLSAFQENLVSTIQKESGLQLRYASLNPSILLQADVVDLQLLRPDGSIFFSAAHARISYNIFQLLSSQNLDAIKEVEVRESQLNFDTVKDKNLIKQDEKADQNTGIAWVRSGLEKLSHVLPQGLNLSFNTMDLNVKGENWLAAFAIVEGHLDSTSEALTFSISVDLSSQQVPGLSFLGAIGGRISAEGTYYRANRQVQAQFVSGPIRTDIGILKPQSFAAVLGYDELIFRKVADNQALDLQLDWNLKSDVISLELRADEWLPSQTFEPNIVASPVLKKILETPLNARAQFRYDLVGAVLSYDYDIQAKKDPSLADQMLLDAKGNQTALGFGESQISFSVPGFTFTLKEKSTKSLIDGSISCVVGAPVVPVSMNFSTSVTASIGAGAIQSVLFSNVYLASGEVRVLAPPLRLHIRNNGLSFSTLLQLQHKGINVGSVTVGLLPDEKAVQTLSIGASNVKIRPSGDFLRAVSHFLGLTLDAALFAGSPEDLSLSGRIAVDEQLGLRINARDIRLSSSSLHKDGFTHDIISGSAIFQNRRLTVAGAILDYGAGQHSIDLGLGFETDDSRSLSLRFDKDKPGAIDLSGTIGPGTSYKLRGSYGFVASGSISNGGISGYARVANVPLAAFGSKSQLSADLSYDLNSLTAWSIRMQSLVIDSIAWNPVFPKRLGHLMVRDAYFLPSSGHIADIRYVDETSTLSGTGDIGYSMETLPDASFSFRMAGQNIGGKSTPSLDPETLAGNASLKGGKLQGRVLLSNSPLQRVVESGVRGYGMVDLSISADLEQSPSSINLTGSAELQRAYLNSDSLFGRTEFSYSSDKITLNKGFVKLQEHQISVDQLVLGTSKGLLDFQGSYQRNGASNSTETLVSAKASWLPPLDTADNPLFSSFSGRIQIDPVKSGDIRQSSYRIGLQSQGNALEISETQNAAFRGKIQKNGDFLVQLQRALPITGTISGFIRQAKIEANITNFSTDLKTISEVLNAPIFTMKEGTVNGTLRIVGDLTDPDFYGSLKAEKLRANFTMTPEDISAPHVYLVFEEKRMRLLGVNVVSGGNTTRIEGDFVLSRWNVPSFTIKAETRDGPGLHIKSDFTNIVMDGYARGMATVAFSPSQIEVNGQIMVEDTTLQVKQPDGSQNPKNSGAAERSLPFVINLALKTGKSVEFFYPSKDLPILRTTFDMNQTAAFAMNQNADTWSLAGTLSARGGEIAYLKRNFFLRQASMVFNENQVHFDPRFSARADTKAVIDRKSTKVSLIFENTSLSNWKPRIESDVPMTTEQLTAVMTGDIIKTDSADQPLNYGAALANTIGYASQFAFMNTIESKIRSATNLDIFSLRTNLLPNMALSAVSADPLDNQTISLGKYFDDTTLQIGKFIGTDVYIEVLTQLRSVQSYGINANPLGIALDVELNVEWETPFVNILWSFAPKNAQDLFLRDNTLQFSWRVQ